MQKPLRVIFRVVLLFAAACPALLRAEDKTCEVNVNAYLTPEGKAVPPPSPGHPVYYVPVVLGYREIGPAVAGEKPPERKAITEQLAKALADQGYFVVTPTSPPPTLVLVIGWGSLHPDTDIATDNDSDASDPESNTTTSGGSNVYNQKQMLSIVAGRTGGNLDLNFEREAVMQAAASDRYFVVVMAYDFEAATQHQKKLLWRTNMSVDSARVSFEDVAKGLIASAGPMLGRETLRPKWAQVPVREGKVMLGPTEVIEYLDEPRHATPPQTDKPAKPSSATESKP